MSYNPYAEILFCETCFELSNFRTDTRILNCLLTLYFVDCKCKELMDLLLREAEKHNQEQMGRMRERLVFLQENIECQKELVDFGGAMAKTGLEEYRKMGWVENIRDKTWWFFYR